MGFDLLEGLPVELRGGLGLSLCGEEDGGEHYCLNYRDDSGFGEGCAGFLRVMK